MTFEQFYSLARKFRVTRDVAVINRLLTNSVNADSFVVVYNAAGTNVCDCDVFRIYKICFHAQSADKLAQDVDPLFSSNEARDQTVLTVSDKRLWLVAGDTYRRTLVAMSDRCQVRAAGCTDCHCDLHAVGMQVCSLHGQ
jgi:hypothetical protein